MAPRSAATGARRRCNCASTTALCRAAARAASCSTTPKAASARATTAAASMPQPISCTRRRPRPRSARSVTMADRRARISRARAASRSMPVPTTAVCRCRPTSAATRVAAAAPAMRVRSSTAPPRPDPRRGAVGAHARRSRPCHAVRVRESASHCPGKGGSRPKAGAAVRRHGAMQADPPLRGLIRPTPPQPSAITSAGRRRAQRTSTLAANAAT